MIDRDQEEHFVKNILVLVGSSANPGNSIGAGFESIPSDVEA
jgi:hypothetical protein